MLDVQNSGLNPNYTYNDFKTQFAPISKGDAFNSHAAGIFSGLNYQNAYKEPEPINLQQGFQGVEYAQYGTNVGPSLSNYQVTSENPQKSINAFEGPIANKINFNGIGEPLKSEFETVVDNNDILEALVGMQGVSKTTLKKLSKNKLIDLLKVNSKNILNIAAQQGIQETAGSWQYGGNMNMTGYTPNTSTMGNKINTIPGGNISMSNTPFPVVGIGKDGLTKIMQSGQQYNFGYNDNVNELPLQQFGGIAGALSNINPQQVQDAYLSQLTSSDPNDPYSYVNATPEFNARMIAGASQQPMQPTQIMSGLRQASSTDPYADGSIYQQGVPLGQENNPYGFNGVSAPVPNSGTPTVNKTNILTTDKDPWEYKKENGVWKTKQKNKTKWNTAKGGALDAIENMWGSGTFKPKNSDSVIPKKSIASSVSSNYAKENAFRSAATPKQIDTVNSITPESGYNMQVTDNNMNTTSNINSLVDVSNIATNTISNTGKYQQMYPIGAYPNYGAPVGTLSEEDKAGVLSGSLSAVASAIPIGPIASGLGAGGKYVMANLPKVGKAVQYGANYIDEAGNIVSAAGSKLGKAPKAVIDATKDFFKMGSKPNVYDDILLGKVNKAGKYIDPITKKFTSAPIDSRGGLQKLIQDGNFSTSFKNTLNSVVSTGKKLSDKAYKALTPIEKNAYDSIAKKAVAEALDASRFANAANITPGVRTAWGPILKQYGGYIQLPKLQFGGEINNDHTYPIHPITEEFMEIQTEYGETIMLPDGTIVNVKASDRHKNMDKDEVTDILPEGAYVFSADPKMKFSVNSKIGTTKVEDMNLGQSVFEYKENEITPGPEKIYVKDVFFGNSKKELTTAEISNNIKKTFELRDQKNDFFVDRAVEENKEQRVEYLSILKAMNEFKKPKSKREVPQAQYGMDISSMLPMQSTQNALDGVMGYSNRAMDPFKRMDNTRLNMFNTSFKQPSLPSIPKMYAEGGDVPHAQLGKLLRYTVPVAYIGSEYFGNKAKKKQEKINNEELRQWDSLTNNYIDNVNKTGGIDMLTNMGTYAASLNVPRQAYDNMSQQSALQNEGYNRQRAILNADKYSAQNSLGAGTSMARFAGNNQNLGQYLAASQQGYNGQVSDINSRLAQLEGNNTSARMDLTSQGNNNYNNSLNAFNTQVYNANVTGLGNVGRSLGTANANLGNAKYMTGQERLSLLRQQRDAAQAAKDKVVGDWEGALGSAGQVAMMAAGIPGGLGGGGQQNTTAQQQQMQTNQYMQQQMNTSMNNLLQNRNNSFNAIQPLPLLDPRYTNSYNPGATVNRSNPYGFNFNGFNIYN